MNAFLKISYLTNLFASTKDVDGYEELQKRIIEKSSYLEKALLAFKNCERILKDCLSKMLTLNSDFIKTTLSPEEKDIHATAVLIFQKISNELAQNNNFVQQFISNLEKMINQFNHEKDLYEELKKTNKDLREAKEKLKKDREEYHKLGKESESKIKQFAKYNLQYITKIEDSEILQGQLFDLIVSPKRALENYRESNTKINQLITRYNQNQTKLYNFLPDIGDYDGVFYFQLVKMYKQHLELEKNYLDSNIEQIKSMKSLETNTKLKELIEYAENNRRDEKILNIMQYQSDLDIVKCKSEKDFKIMSGTKYLINKYIDQSIFPEYSEEQENKNYEVYTMIKRLFDEKGEIDSKLSEDFINLINDPSVHKYAFIILSILRTNSRFEKTKSLIDLLGKGFNILLENAAKNKLFDNIKNCIILSQTYFYIDENKNKIYIFEYIKNNKWMKSASFWRSFIDDVIKSEFIRFEKIYPDSNFSIEKNINVSKKIKEKLNEVVFSQLLTYVNNMKDFCLDKRVIIKITDEFIDKYNYLSKSNINTIYDLVTEGKEDIEQLKKEYSPNLEEELNNETNNEETEKSKENENNIINEDKENKEDKDKEEKENKGGKEENINNEKNEINNQNNEEKKEDDDKVDS
jgi:hypothetical protein